MKTATLNHAIAEAKRFIAAAEAVAVYTTYNGTVMHELREPGKQAAATKRASLDLTRALAQIRRTS